MESLCIESICLQGRNVMSNEMQWRRAAGPYVCSMFTSQMHSVRPTHQLTRLMSQLTAWHMDSYILVLVYRSPCLASPATAAAERWAHQRPNLTVSASPAQQQRQHTARLKKHSSQEQTVQSHPISYITELSTFKAWTKILP